MKIVLFAMNASRTHTALGVRCLRGALRRAGFAPVLLEYNLKDPRLSVLEALVREQAELYAFSAYIWNIRELLALAENLRALRPEARIVFGGPEVSYEDASFFARAPFVDALIRGEGETAITSLCRAPLPVGAHAILDGTPDPDFASAGVLYDPGEQGTLFYYESSRGCPYACSYCLSGAGGRVRAKSAGQTLADLLELQRQGRRCKIVKLVDRTFNFDRARAKEILRGLADPAYTATYHLEVCADLLDAETIALLHALPPGKVQIEAGVQSLNPATLRAVGRTQNPQTVLRRLREVRQGGGVHVHADLIAGLPFETEESFAAAFDAVYPCADLLQLGFLKLLKGSPLRARAAEYGMVFEAQPPYTVLATDTMPYAVLQRLHRTDDVLQRFGGASFSASRTVLHGRVTPFAFFAGLGDRLQAQHIALQTLSQRAAFALYYDYASPFAADREVLRSAVAFDFLLHETGPLPQTLGAVEAATPAEASALLRELPLPRDHATRSAVVVLRPRFCGGAPVVIDRCHHTVLSGLS